MFIDYRSTATRQLMVGALILAAALTDGCSTQPIDGGFQTVCDKLVAMNPLDRASNMSANGKRYAEVYGIYYDSITDALYTKAASGDRDYILKGNLMRSMFLIDDHKDKAPG